MLSGKDFDQNTYLTRVRTVPKLFTFISFGTVEKLIILKRFGTVKK